jgi:trimethylamine corrinoid protein
MEKEAVLENLKNAIIEGNPDKAQENAEQVVSLGIDPLEAVDRGLAPGMAVVGDRFETGEAYLPELLLASETFKAAMAVLDPEIERQNKQTVKMGTVLVASVKGDQHSIGKNIVATVLDTNGFDVVDIGIDKSAMEIIQEAQKVKADVIGLSALMTTTLPAQKEVIEALKELGLRDRFRVIVGGGPVSQSWADSIDADGYGDDAMQATGLVKKLLET